jgi:hypothetical protein
MITSIPVPSGTYPVTPVGSPLKLVLTVSVPKILATFPAEAVPAIAPAHAAEAIDAVPSATVPRATNCGTVALFPGQVIVNPATWNVLVKFTGPESVFEPERLLFPLLSGMVAPLVPVLTVAAVPRPLT